jgi:hypothetical protein
MDEGEVSGQVLCASAQELIIYKKEERRPGNMLWVLMLSGPRGY